MSKAILKAFLMVGALASCLCAVPLPVIFTLDPADGAISGAPGDTVGWGFTIQNNTDNYLLFDSSNFCGVGGDPQFTDCSVPYNPPTGFGPAFGTYTDYIANNFTEIAPGTSLTEAFDATLMTGVGAYTIDPGAQGGSLDSGNVYVSFQQFQGDPLAGGSQVGGDSELAAPASVLVTSSATVPEPRTAFALAGALLLGLGFLRKRRRMAV